MEISQIVKTSVKKVKFFTVKCTRGDLFPSENNKRSLQTTFLFSIEY